MVPSDTEQDLHDPLTNEPAPSPPEIPQSTAPDGLTPGSIPPAEAASMRPATVNTWKEIDDNGAVALNVPKTREDCISFLNTVKENGSAECILADEDIAPQKKFPIICEMFKILFATQTDVIGAVENTLQTAQTNAETNIANTTAMQKIESEVNKLEDAEVSSSETQQSTASTVDNEGKSEDGEVPLLHDNSAGGTAPSKPDETQNENANGESDIGGDATVTGETGESVEIQNAAIPGSTVQPVKPDKNGNCDCDDEIEKYVNNQFGGGNVQEKLQKFKRLTEAGKHPTDYQDLNKVDVALAEKSKYQVSFL